MCLTSPATGLAFDAGNWNMPGVAGPRGGDRHERLAAYLGAKLSEEDVADAAGAMSVLHAIPRVRTGQQNGHLSHEAIGALDELGVGRPPFDRTAAWSTIRERSTLAALDLQTAVARLPR